MRAIINTRAEAELRVGVWEVDAEEPLLSETALGNLPINVSSGRFKEF